MSHTFSDHSHCRDYKTFLAPVGLWKSKSIHREITLCPNLKGKSKEKNYCTNKNHVRTFTEYVSVIREDTNNQMQEIYFATDCKRDDLE